MNIANLLLITGIAPHSLGETVVKKILNYKSDCIVVGIDRARNHSLIKSKNYIGLKIDLNPLSFPGGLNEFSKFLFNEVKKILKQTNKKGVECLVQAAGVYNYGTFLEHNLSQRKSILGVNFLARVEILHAVMLLNQSCGLNNRESFTFVDVGSFQALYARANRPLYASSKSVGIDFCTSLEEGKEACRTIYFAPGPIDTHMLHENYWIMKAKGSKEFFYKVFHGSRDRYQKIFVKCDETALRQASDEFGYNTEELVLKLGKYRRIRKKSIKEPPGILRRDDCAEILTKTIFRPNIYKSGIYVATANSKQLCALKEGRFYDLNRKNLFERMGRPIN